MVIFLINGYNIKKINNEEVLYLYMDFDSEFAKIDKKNNKDIKNYIKDYIKKNNINFKGGIVALIVGGVMIGTVTLNKPKVNYNSIVDNNRIVAILNENNIENNVEEQEEQPNLEVKETNEEVIIEESKIDGNNRTNSVTNINNENNSTKTINQNESSSSINNQNNSNQVVTNINESIQDEVIDNSTYVNLYRKNGSVIKIELEEYIIGVVGAEMPAAFNIEALKAQAVVARTYALNCIRSNKKLTDNNSTQNYKSNDELRSMWGSSFNTYYNKVSNAVNSTKGLYLTYNGSIIDAVYHSTSNGYTEDSIYVWGNSKPYLKSVESIYDSTNKSFLYTMFLSYEDISNKLNNYVDINTEFNILNRNSSGRVVDIEINGVTYSGVSFRNKLGLRSTDFDIEKGDDGVTFITRGYGHGVGMSQYGANGMANNGFSYRDILLHYYTGVSINSL